MTETTAAQRLDRIGTWCPWHQQLFAYAIADHLDSPDATTSPTEAFDRYEAKCRAGDGCKR